MNPLAIAMAILPDPRNPMDESFAAIFTHCVSIINYSERGILSDPLASFFHQRRLCLGLLATAQLRSPVNRAYKNYC